MAINEGQLVHVAPTDAETVVQVELGCWTRLDRDQPAELWRICPTLPLLHILEQADHVRRDGTRYRIVAVRRDGTGAITELLVTSNPLPPVVSLSLCVLPSSRG